MNMVICYVCAGIDFTLAACDLFTFHEPTKGVIWLSAGLLCGLLGIFAGRRK